MVAVSLKKKNPEFHQRETTIQGSRNATAEDFQHVERCLREGLIPDQALNTHRLQLAELPSRFAELLDPARGVVKAIVEI